MTGDQDLLQQFLIEGREIVDRALADIATLQAEPADAGAIDSLFRSLHTLKGSTGLFDLPALGQLLHGAETILEASRGEGRVENLSAIVEALDVTENWLDLLEAGQAPSGGLVDRTRSLAASLDSGPGEVPTREDQPRDTAWANDLALGADIAGDLVAIRYRPSGDAYFRGDDPIATARALPGLVRLVIDADPLAAGDVYDPFHCRLRLDAVCVAPMDEVREALKWVSDEVELQAVTRAAPRRAATALRTLRVDAARLDAVAAMVNQLVVAKNALQHEAAQLAAAAQGDSRALAAAQGALDRIVAELHTGVTDLRLVEIGRLLGRFPRQAREIAEALGKPLDVQVSGESVSLDKAIVEGLYEPLLHLVRNAIDHGVESTAERMAAGKPARATLNLSAQAQGDEIILEVADDGRGLDIARIRAKAVSRQIIAPAAAAALSDEKTADLVFAPGFSTAETVSDLSGRGVGMDAVRAAVARLGGRVSLQNRPGEGLVVRLSLPAHVVLTKILAVRAGDERFGIAMDAIAELHSVRREEVTPIRHQRTYVHRRKVLPLLRLSDVLGLPSEPDAASFPVLSVTAGGEAVGIQVGALEDRFEAPLQPLAGVLAGYPGVRGTVMEGSGRVLLVLDLAELAS